MRLLSDAAEYGLRAVVWLAEQPPGVYRLQAIADATRATPGYLIKVLQALARAGIVTAHRGALGGFALAREASSTTVLEVVAAIDPIERIRTCPLGLQPHGRELCPMHRSIDDALAMLERAFGRLTIGSLLGRAAPAPVLCAGSCGSPSPLTSSRTTAAAQRPRAGRIRDTNRGASRARATKP